MDLFSDGAAGCFEDIYGYDASYDIEAAPTLTWRRGFDTAFTEGLEYGSDLEVSTTFGL